MKAVIDNVFWISLCLAVVLIPSAIVWNAVAADGKVNYCYIRQQGSTFVLWGNVDWRMDDRVSYWKSSDDAREEAKRLACNIQP